MKGVSFQNGVEFKIHIEGESWPQGSSVKGNVEATVRNPSAAASLETRVILALGNEKKVKAKSPDAFEVLEEASLAGPNGGAWSFDLAIDAPITDASSSLYILYGSGEGLETLGQLRLNVLPHEHIKDLVDTFVTQFRFALKKVSAGKNGYVEVKLDPPSVKEWASLEQLVMRVKLLASALEVQFTFTRQKIDAIGTALTSKTIKIEVEREWPFAQVVHEFNQRLNKDAIQTALEDVIAEYRK